MEVDAPAPSTSSLTSPSASISTINKDGISPRFHHRGDIKWVYGRTVDAPTAKAFSLQLRLILRLHFALFDVRNGIGAVLVNERCIIIYHEYPFNQYP